jgi:hypothetical protein
MICFGCLLDKIADARDDRCTASGKWCEGWYYRAATLEIRGAMDVPLETYRWDYSPPGLDAAIDTARMVHGSVHILFPVYDELDKVDDGFSVEVYPHPTLRYGNEEIPLGDHDHDDHHGDN